MTSTNVLISSGTQLPPRPGWGRFEIVAGPQGWLVGLRKTKQVSSCLSRREQCRWGGSRSRVKNFDQRENSGLQK
jgi:hypothetical protein